ncbi:MAG: hypothetical protein Q9162_005678 [Coniocarpon cinnabarinum]
MLEVHHLERSQSERVVWLCEELGIEYKLHVHQRNPETALAPPIFKELHAPGSAPVIVDTRADGKRIVIGESGACVEYIIHVYGNGRLAVKPEADNYADYLSWFHFCNGSYQPGNSRNMVVNMASGGKPPDSPILQMFQARQETFRQMLDQRLGEVPYLAGDELTAADIMMVYSLSTNRGYSPNDLTPYKHILEYLQRVSQREGYKRARAKGDPETPPLTAPVVERFKFGALK